MEMVLLGAIMGVTVLLAALSFKVQPLPMIRSYSKFVGGIDFFILGGGIVVAWVNEISWEELALWLGLFVVFCGIQQEAVMAMKEKFVAYVKQHADNAYFVIDEIVAEGEAVGWVFLEDGDDEFVCAALCVDDDVKEISSEYEYQVSLYIGYDVFGQPKTLMCRLISESDEE